MLFLLLAACGGDPDAGHEHPAASATPGAPTTEGAAPHDHDDARDHDDAAHEGGPHAHAASHGGEVKMAGDLHVEARFTKSGVMVWLRDAAEAPIDAATVTAGAVVKTGAGVQSVPMMSMGDHLHAALPLEEGTAAEAVLTLTVGGKPVSVDFHVEEVGALAEHDHTTLHGGVLSMWGDNHVEYLAKDGEVRFWVSDAHRVARREGVTGSAKVGDTVVPLTFDPATGLLSGKATPTAGQRVTLDVTVGAQTFSLVF